MGIEGYLVLAELGEPLAEFFVVLITVPLTLKRSISCLAGPIQMSPPGKGFADPNFGDRAS